MTAPVLVKSIPNQIVNEQAAYGPFNLKEFIQVPETANLSFSAQTKSGDALPKGMICTIDGIVTGIPAKGTQGFYDIVLTIANDDGAITAGFTLTIQPSLADSTETQYLDELKAQVWQALDQKLPVPPDIAALYDRPITMMDIYYLLERWNVLKVWDAFNLEPAGEKHLLHLPDVSPHYDIFDRGSCIVACPKDLFSYERTMEDALQTSRVLAREVYKRGWTIEMAGLDKMVRAAWVELQHLGDEYGKQIKIVNFNPTPDDVKLYNTQNLVRRMARNQNQ